MRFASLGSGSRGNSLVVEAGASRVLLDCGFSAKSTLERLGRLGLAGEDISAILVTHEHGDHVSGVFRFASRFRIPVYLTHGTQAATTRIADPMPQCRRVDPSSAFSVEAIEILPFAVPHDAREPVQYVFGDGKHRLGVLTDSGSITAHIVNMLRRCDALVLECNHDAELLAASDYPAMLKRRILGNLGHLENRQAAALLAEIETRRLQHVIAAHLSERNNRPDLARTALAAALNCTPEWIGVATQEDGFGWREVA
ncbi:MAG: MBL fold metallo-hydrolase [Propionivibrio sp.]